MLINRYISKKGFVPIFILTIAFVAGIVISGYIYILASNSLKSSLVTTTTVLPTNSSRKSANTKLLTTTTKFVSKSSVVTTIPKVIHKSITTTKATQTPTIAADYKTREIKQYGYTIFVGAISDNPQHNFNQYLDQIIPYLLEIKFPRALIEDSAFIIVDTNTKGRIVSVGNALYNLSGMIDSIESKKEGGVFISFPNAQKFIGINSTNLPSGFYPILTHELGHVIYNVMTKAEKDEWSKLRGEPVIADPYRKWTDWELSRNEDFAEVFKYLYGQNKNADNYYWDMHTAYKTRPCRSYYTTEELDKLLLDPNEYYKLMNIYSPCYKNEPPDDQTKAFIQSVLDRIL
jgi:hypothetical protein